MKQGDKVPAFISGHEVTQAEVKEVNQSDGTVTLLVPATLVVMGLRTELTDLPTTTEQPTTQVVVDEVVRTPAAEVPAVEPVVPATAVEQPADAGNTSEGATAPDNAAAAAPAEVPAESTPGQDAGGSQ